MKRKVQAVLFDYDGTLIDSMPAIYRGVKAVMDECGLPMEDFSPFLRSFSAPYVDWYRVRGVTLPNEKIREIFFAHAFTDDAPYFPEVAEVFEKLREKGLFLAIVSAHPSADTIWKRVVERDRLLHHHHPVVARANHKTAPIRDLLSGNKIDPERCLYVGDLASDVLDAKEAGTLTAAYLGPHGHRIAFEKAEPHYYLETLHQIFDHVE
jgi:phosphoglycolate phosphatase